MKVEYFSTLERINDVIDVAERDDREIDFIELSPHEWWHFRNELSTPAGSMIGYFTDETMKYRGIDINKTEFPPKPSKVKSKTVKQS